MKNIKINLNWMMNNPMKMLKLEGLVLVRYNDDRERFESYQGYSTGWVMKGEFRMLSNDGFKEFEGDVEHQDE